MSFTRTTSYTGFDQDAATFEDAHRPLATAAAIVAAAAAGG